MKKARLSPTLLLLASLLAAPLQGCIEMAVVGAGAAVLSANDRRTTGTQIEDERIELVASNRFGERFADKAHINVTSYNRNVLLTGEVPDDKVKAEAEKIVAERLKQGGAIGLAHRRRGGTRGERRGGDRARGHRAGTQRDAGRAGTERGECLAAADVEGGHGLLRLLA